MKKYVITVAFLLLQGCSFTVTDCEFKPSASVSEEFDIKKPIQDQIQPETEVSCSY